MNIVTLQRNRETWVDITIFNMVLWISSFFMFLIVFTDNEDKCKTLIEANLKRI